MAANREVMREFLMQLGFQVDETGARRFVGSILGVSKVATQAAATIASVAVAGEAMVQVFASGFEKLYYASQRTKASVESLQAIKFGFKQIGLTVDGALQSVENFTRSMRMNPGMAALLKGLGVDTRGKDSVQQLYGLVGRLSKMPHFVGARWAERFGLDEQTFLMMKERLPELIEADKKRRELNKQGGVDAEAAAGAAREYSNAIDRLLSRMGILYDMVSIKLLPLFRDFIGMADEGLDSLTTWAAGFKGVDLGEFSDDLHKIVGDLGELWKMANASPEDNWLSKTLATIGQVAKASAHYVLGLVHAILQVGKGDLSGAWTTLKESMAKQFSMLDAVSANILKPVGAPAGAGGAPAAPAEPRAQDEMDRRGRVASYKALARRMAASYGIPPSIFESLVKKESGWNPLALGTSGEIGLTQLMPGTAKEVGVNNLEDPEENLRGGAMYLAKQFKRFGNWNDALSAYNAGAGNLKAGRGYAQAVLQNAGMGGNTQVSQTNVFNISGPDAEANARAVGRELDRKNQDLVRNGTGTYR